MRLTQRAQGRRWRRKGWPDGAYLDVRRVTSGKFRTVFGTNEVGGETIMITHQTEEDWIEIPKTQSKEADPNHAEDDRKN